MISAIIQILLTLFYCLIGLLLAFPLSYFFQDGLYGEMSFAQYVQGGIQSLYIGARFGSLDVYRYTAIGAMIAMIVIGKWLQKHFRKSNK